MFMSRAHRGAASPKSIVRLAIVAGFLVLPFATVQAAESCESTFKSSGSKLSGLSFEAIDADTGVSAGDAIIAMKALAGPEGFTVGKQSLSGGRGSLQLVQPASAVARSYTVDVSATNGIVSMKSDLPSGMDASAPAVKTYMCGLLAKVRPGRIPAVDAVTSPEQGVSGGVPAPAPRANVLPVPFSPEKTAALCNANVAVNVEFADDTRATIGSWTLFDNGEDAHASMARVKQAVVSSPGMRVVSERYFGRQGTIELMSSPVPATNDPADDVPMRVDVDTGMGAVSVVMQTTLGGATFGGWSAYHVCRMAAIATGTPLPAQPGNAPEKPKRKIFNNPFKKESSASKAIAERAAVRKAQSDALDALYQRAAHAGKAFVIVPVLGMDRKYKDLDTKQVQTEKMAEFWADGSASVQWRASGEKAEELSIGPWTNLTRVGLHGFVEYVDVGKARYALYLVDPGDYDLMAARMDRRGGVVPKPTGGKVAAATVGTFVAKNTSDRFYDLTQEWHDATYTTNGYDQSYCALQEMPSGRCIQWGSQRQQYQTQTSAAGYRDKIKAKMVPGLSTTAELAKPFASFVVAAGDIVLLDGFTLDREGVEVDANSCKAFGDGAKCGLTDFVLWRLPAVPRDVQAGLTASLDPVVGARWFSSAVPKVLNVVGKPKPEPMDGYEAGWARQFGLKAH